MSWGCKHRWAEVRRSLTPGVREIVEVRRVTVAQLQALAAGQTHVELRCEECGMVKGVTLAGQLAPAHALDPQH